MNRVLMSREDRYRRHMFRGEPQNISQLNMSDWTTRMRENVVAHQDFRNIYIGIFSGEQTIESGALWADRSFGVRTSVSLISIDEFFPASQPVILYVRRPLARQAANHESCL